MICVIALIVFGVLGIFSAKYRLIAKEAADCVFRRITLRKCETGLDQRLKNQITSRLAPKFPKLGRFLFKYFEVLSWLMLLLLLFSLYGIGSGVYNYAVYGNCNGPQNENIFCILDPTGANSQYSGIKAEFDDKIIYPKPGDDAKIGPADAKVTVVEFVCLTCPYSKKAEPLMKGLVNRYRNESVLFSFKLFPLPTHNLSIEAAIALMCAGEQGKYFEARDFIFEVTPEQRSHENFRLEVEKTGIDMNAYDECYLSDEARAGVMRQVKEGADAHVFGTPTFFINERIITGVFDEKKLTSAIDAELRR